MRPQSLASLRNQKKAFEAGKEWVMRQTYQVEVTEGFGVRAGRASQVEHLVGPENCRECLFSWEGLWSILATVNSLTQERVIVTVILHRTLTNLILFLLFKYTKV